MPHAAGAVVDERRCDAVSFVGRFLKADEESLFGKGYDAQFQREGKTPPPVDVDGLRTWCGVGYDPEAPDDPLRQLDLYRPASAAPSTPLPCLIFVHGGIWRSGDKSDASHVYSNLCAAIACRGWLVANANTRLAPEADWQVQADDVARSVRFLNENAAEFGGDGSRIVLAGHSSGGHLVSLVALDARRLERAGVEDGTVRGVAPISAVFDVAEFAQEAPTMRWMIRAAFGDDVAAWGDASPMSWAGPQAPPFYITVADRDAEYLVRQAHRLDRLLGESGVRSGVALMRDTDHFSVLARVGEPDYCLVEDLVDFADSVVGGVRAERDWAAAKSDAGVEG